MRTEKEQGSRDLAERHKDNAETFQCHENIREKNSRTDKENLNRISCDSMALERNETHLVDVNGDDKKENPHQDKVYTRCFAKGESLEKDEKDSACYMDKSVMVCYKDSACHVVKDICVDEGSPVHDKFLSESRADGRKDLVKVEEVKMDILSIPVMETEKPKAEITENDLEKPGSGDSQSSSGTDSDKCFFVQNQFEDRTPIEEFENAVPGKTENSIHVESFTLGQFLSMETNQSLSKDSSHGLIDQSSKRLNRRKSSEADGDADVILESDQTKKDTDLLVPSPVSTSQEAVKTHHDPTRSNEESEISSSENNELKDKRFQEDDNDSNLLQRGLGETSFAAAGPVSGLITYSGPIAFSGSLSVRSDGSNASARSFAFPVLAPEWNSSPVRMARADKRHLRRQNGWKQTLFCCRF